MGTSQSKLIDQYWQRLREIEFINIERLSLEDLKGSCHAFEKEMSILESKKASKLPEVTRDRFKRHYLTIIRGYKDTVREIETLNELIEELTKLKDLKYKREATFEKKISTARQELRELKSNKTIYSYHKWKLILTAEKELQRIDKEIIGQILSQVPQEILTSIKKNLTNVNECKNIVRCYELTPELGKMKAPINKSQETTFERQIPTARQKLEELKLNKTIGFYYRKDLISKLKQN